MMHGGEPKFKPGICLCRDLAPIAERPTAMSGYPNQGYYSRLLIFIAVRKLSLTSSILSFCSARKFDIDVEINLSEIQMWALYVSLSRTRYTFL